MKVFYNAEFCKCVLCATACRRRSESKQSVTSVSTMPGGGVVRNLSADHELATLRELPTVTVQTSNALYTIKLVKKQIILFVFRLYAI